MNILIKAYRSTEDKQIKKLRIKMMTGTSCIMFTAKVTMVHSVCMNKKNP